jgi:hypothetical protein
MIKSNLAVVATLILLIPAGIILAQPNIGVIAGANGAVLKGDAPKAVSYNRSWGLNLSVAGEFELSDDILLCLQPGYSQNGTIVAVEKKDIKDPVDSLNLSLDYLSVPVLVKVLTTNGRTYFSGGLEFGYLVDKEAITIGGSESVTPIPDAFQDFNVSMIFGFGIIFPFSTSKLTIEIRYNQGLSNLAKSEDQLENVSIPVRIRSNMIQLQAGWHFGL